MRAGWGAGAWACAIGSAFVAGALASACVSIEPWACARDEDCVAASGGGRCEATRWCSYPDEDCASDRRYSDLAGPYAGLCTEPEPEPEPGTSTGSEDPMATSSGSSESGMADTSTDESDTGSGCAPPCVPSGTARWTLVLSGEEPGHDKWNAVLADGAGDLIAVGHVQADPRDAWIVRVSPEGVPVASRAYDVEGEADLANDIALAADGDLWVCGSRRLANAEAAWIARFPATLAGEPEEVVIAHDVCVTIGVAADDTVVAGGRDYGGASHAWAYVFPPWGLEDGTTTIDVGTDSSDGLRAAVRTDRGFLMGGARDDAGLVFVLQDGALGAILVETGLGGGVQSLAAIGDVFVAGGFTDSAGTLHDEWITARELDGTERWTFQPEAPSPLNDEIESVAIAPTGEVVAVGFSGPAGHQRSVMKLDPEGELLWSVVLDLHAPDVPQASDIARDVVVLPDGDIVVVGEVTAADGTLDAWMARIAP